MYPRKYSSGYITLTNIEGCERECQLVITTIYPASAGYKQGSMEPQMKDAR